MVQTIELIVAKVGAKEFRLFFTRVSPFVFPNLINTLGWVGSQIWKNFLFGGDLPLDPNADTKMIMGRVRRVWFF